MTAPARDHDDLVLLVCITVGAVLGFSLTGGAAVGTAIGAASGMGLTVLHRRQRHGVRSSSTAAP